jgi:proteasome lid subunit RPN8/RPN11
MSLHEVGGLLAGRYEPASRTLTVAAAVPVREASGGATTGRVDVEFDAEDEFAARERIASGDVAGVAAPAVKAAGGEAGAPPPPPCVVVGWYHSHPTFPPLPSGIDVVNQAAQQAAHARAGLGEGHADDFSPFVGAIVSPYDAATRSARRGGCVADVSWFRVEPHSGSVRATAAAGGAAVVPKRVRAEAAAPAAGGGDAAPSSCLAHLLPSDQLAGLAARYAHRPHAAPLLAPWPAAAGGSRLDKLKASLAARLSGTAPAADVDAVLARVGDVLAGAWGGAAAANGNGVGKRS